VSAENGRHVLLDYARKRAGARLGLLFRVDTSARQLALVERCGRAPLHKHLAEHAHIPLDGLFSMALSQQDLLCVSDASSDTRSLSQERSWMWQGGQVWLCVAGAVRAKPGARGVLVLCSEPGAPGASDAVLTEQVEREILICAVLLGVYLEDGAGETRAAIDRERSRIARDLHDGAAQDIAHAIHALELAQRVLEKQPLVAQREIQRARETLLESLDALRHDISALLPAPLEQGNFAEAARALLEDFSQQEPTITLRREGIQIQRLPSSLEAPLYRFLQEALNNVRKHARARYVSVEIQSSSDLLVAQVSDDGVGFAVEQAQGPDSHAAKNGAATHFGLRSMQERIKLAGGTLEIASKPGAGTTLKARFPLSPPPLALTNREREVLRLLVDGATNRAIADTLSVSIETVKSHMHHIMQKLQVKDRTQAAVLAARKQWV
ncbi:MAG TPA: hybrid sensor histidine kinase/response regulator transcription factor, partial [Ktedonobacteraceae bacterium]